MSQRIFLILAFLLLVSQTPAEKSEEPYVEVDGIRYTETDLAESPEFASLKQTYREQLTEMLKDLGREKLFEREAQAQGVSVESYKEKLRSGAPEPQEPEIRGAYDRLREDGRLDESQSFEVMRDSVANYLRARRISEIMDAERRRLEKKYGFKAHSGPVVRWQVDVDGEPVRGGAKQAESTPVTIVEFADFECPFCRRVQDTTARLRAKYGKRLRWVVKDFPLAFHQNAVPAHVAANCVFLQSNSSYWKFFDGLYADSQPEDYLAPANLRNLAAASGVDLKKFDACVKDSDTVEAEIEEDIAQGQAVGVNGTPSFFINGRLIAGAQDYEAFESVIEEELRR